MSLNGKVAAGFCIWAYPIKAIGDLRISMSSEPDNKSPVARKRTVSLTLLYPVVLIVGSAAAMTEILPHRVAIGELSNSGWTGIFWSGLLFVLSTVAFLRFRWEIWWGKFPSLVFMIFWGYFLLTETYAYLAHSMYR